MELHERRGDRCHTCSKEICEIVPWPCPTVREGLAQQAPEETKSKPQPDPDPIRWCIASASSRDHSATHVYAASAELRRLRQVEAAARALAERIDPDDPVIRDGWIADQKAFLALRAALGMES